MNPVAIIGGGITGLTAGYYLKQRGVPVTVYEAANRCGGAVQTTRSGGFLAECGPNTILETSPLITALIRDLGLEGRRWYSDPAAENRFLVRGGKPMLLPNSLPAFIASPLFSPGAKLRLMAEPFIGHGDAETEESVAEFVVRRLGREFLDYAIDPLVGGIYAGNPANLSVKEAFPKLLAVERRYRSLILGQFLGARERKKRAEVSKQNAKKISFDEGLQVLIDELARQLGPAVCLGSPVNAIEETPHGWWLKISPRSKIEYREHSAVLYAGTADRLAQIQFTTHQALGLGSLSEIYHPPVASVVLGFRRAEVAHPLNGFGMLIPRVEGFNTLGAIFSSSLFPGRAPARHVTITSYIGGARNPSLALREPGELTSLVVADLRKLLGVTGEPVYEHQFVHTKAIPQYEVGYGRFKNLMFEAEVKCPGFFMAGHYRDGISLGDSIVSGHNTAGRVATFLHSAAPASPAAESSVPAAA
jgi:oxygen-dependent protoporphyrinogen oxidase